MIEIKDGRIYFYNLYNSKLKTLDFQCISAYVCPECKNVLSAYFIGRIMKESIIEYIENEKLKYGYETGQVHGAQWISLSEHPHKEVCKWEVAGALSRGLPNSVNSFLKIHDAVVKDKQALINRIESQSMPGFIKVNDTMGADLPILLYNENTIINAGAEGLTFDEKWERRKKLGSLIDLIIKSKKRGEI